MPAGDADPAAAGDESPLLAVPPGSRDAKKLSVYDKSTYLRKDGRNDKRKAGARTRSYASKYSKEKSSSTIRNVVPGLSDLNTLSTPTIGTGIYEQDESTYSLREQSEEEKLFNVNSSIKVLIEGLENNNSDLVEQNDEN
jgi:hypothetical protein